MWVVAALSSQTQLYPAPFPTPMWTPDFCPQQPFDHPTGLEVHTPVAQSAFWRQTWRRGPWRFIGQKIPDFWDQGHTLKTWYRLQLGIEGKHAWTSLERVGRALLVWGRNDWPRNFLISPNAPKEIGGKIKVYTSPKQTALDMLDSEDFHYISILKNHPGEKRPIFFKEFQKL